MKFSIEASELKNIINRVSAVTNKKSYLSIVSTLEFSVKPNGILHVVATDLEQFASVSASTADYETGTIYAYVENITKAIANMSGMVSVELASEDIISIKTQKKKTEIRALDSKDVYPEFPSLDMPLAFSANEGDLINTFIALKPMLASPETSRPIFSGFNVDAIHGRCISCDTFRYGVKKLGWNFHNKELNITIPGKIADSLKKIGNAKGKDDISVFVGKPNEEKENTQIAFIGKDYVYAVKLLAGQYIDIDRITPSLVDYELTVDTKEFATVAKEYISITDAKQDALMYFMCENSRVSAATITSKFRTTDVLENSVVSKLYSAFISCFDAKFIREAMELFDGEVVNAHGTQKTATNGYNLHGIIFENDSYTAYVLPVGGHKKPVDEIREFMTES